MALTDLLQSLGEDEDAQAAKLQEILSASTEAAAKAEAASVSVQKLTAKRDELLAEKKRLSRAAKLLVDNGIDPDDDNAEDLLRAKLAAKAESSGESDLQVIEMRSAFNKLNAQVTELKTRAEQAEKDKADLEAKKVKADIEKGVLDQLQASTAGVCLAAKKLFTLNEKAFVMADDGKTVLWQDGDDLKTVDDFAAASVANPEDSIFWAGRGSSGSGTPPGRSSSTSTSTNGTSNNPFAVGGNATEAAKLLKTDRRTADRLIAEARSRGKLSPVMARMLEMQK